MSIHDLRAAVVSAARRAAADAGVDIRMDQENQTSDLPLVEIVEVRERGWDMLYSIGIEATPGGVRHMANVAVATVPSESAGTMDSRQIVQMFEQYRLRRARVEAILSAGCDPLDPPAWSLKARSSTMRLLEAMSDGPPALLRSGIGSQGEIELAMDGLATSMQTRDHLMRSTAPMTPLHETRAPWRYDDERRQLSIYDAAIPETMGHGVVSERMTVSQVVAGSALERLVARIVGFNHAGSTLVLELEDGLEWIAPPPEGVDVAWREGLL